MLRRHASRKLSGSTPKAFLNWPSANGLIRSGVKVSVTRADTPHRELPPSTYPWFIGTVNTAPFGLKSIVGMSGGPIFGFRNSPNGECRYWVVALQSWWDARNADDLRLSGARLRTAGGRGVRRRDVTANLAAARMRPS